MKRNSLTIREIAEMAGCSPSTVSRVLSGRPNKIRITEETKARIFAICREHDYHPSIHAERLFSKRSRIIGFLVAADRLWDDENLSRSLYGVCNALFKVGYRTLPLIFDEAFKKRKMHLEIFNRKEIDGLIVWGAKEGQKFLEELSAAGHPFMLLANQVGAFPSVSSNQYDAISALVGLCRKQGAVRFTAVMDSEGASFISRKNGFVDAVKDLPHKLFLKKHSIAAGYEIAGELLEFKPDAIICGNDEMAVGVERRLLELGVKIPGDVLLTGGDNIMLSENCPIPLTTFDQQAVACAELCVKTLLAHLDEAQPLISCSLPAVIIKRQST